MNTGERERVVTYEQFKDAFDDGEDYEGLLYIFNTYSEKWTKQDVLRARRILWFAME